MQANSGEVVSIKADIDGTQGCGEIHTLMQAFCHPHASGVDPDHDRMGGDLGPKFGRHARNQIIRLGESRIHEDRF